jgi:cysteine-rich repeat protein
VNRAGVVALVVVAALAAPVARPIAAGAQPRPIIDFALVAPTAGTISYDGLGGPLFALDLDVDSVVGLDTPLRDGQTRTCVGCVLTFMTGDFSGHDSTFWFFGAGGSIILTGGVDLNDDGSIGAGDIPLGSTLLEGTFPAEATVTFVGGSFRIVGGAISDDKLSALTEFYGLPGGVYSGGLNISFSARAKPPDGFTSQLVFSGDVFNAGEVEPPTPTPTDTPEPATPTDTPEGPTLTPTDTRTHTRTPTPGPVCGNGILEPGEQCDDGNPFGGDGCEPNCTVSQVCNFAYPPGNTFYVNDDTSDGTGTCLTPDFADIQSAIDAAAVLDGDTILVCPGTYTQAVVVTKELILRSTDGPSSTVIHTSADITLDLRRSATRIEGFTLISDSSNAIDANRICPIANGSCAAPGARGSNLIIANNVIKDSAEGIDWAGRVDCVDIIDNTFADNGKHILLNHDVSMNGPAILVRILRNTVHRGGMAGMPGITVRGNEAIIENNDIHDAAEDALLVGTATLNVRRNLIERSGDDGIVVESDGITCARVPPGGAPRPCLQITENNIHDNTSDGIRVKAGSQTVDTGIHCNNFERNGVGLGNEADSGELDATENWWGSRTGPSGVYSGSGDRIENRSGATTLFLPILCDPCPLGVPSEDDGTCPTITAQFPGYDPDVDPTGRHIAFISKHDLDIDPRTAYGNEEGTPEVFLVTRKYPVSLGNKATCRQPNPARDACGICVGGSRPFAPCVTQDDCPASLDTSPIVLNGNCVLVTQISKNPNPLGSSFTPRLSLRANNLLFESPDDIFGLNPSNVVQAFRWHKKIFKTNGQNPVTLLTDGGPGQNSANADMHLRQAVVESGFNPLGTNPDHNSEIFVFDARRSRWIQVTNTTAPVQNHRPVDRRGKKIIFDSNGDLDNDPKTSFDPANGNGNADGNREIFLARIGRKGIRITQLTDSRFPFENRAGGLGFHNQVAAFSSNGNYTGQNNDGNFEIFTVFKGTIAQETISMGGNSLNPVMNFRARFIAFESTANLIGDGGTNRRIFLIDRNKSTADPGRIRVLSRPTDGDNEHPRISNGRFIVWDSNLNLACSPGNPNCPRILEDGERLVYLYDRQQDR